MKRKLAVAYRNPAALKPFARNSRTHSERQIEQIQASITEFGFTQPILVDGRGGVIAGHGRLLAAVGLEMTEVPVIELKGLTAAQKRAYVIADNKLTLNGGWDESMLAEELKALGAQGFDLALTGFDEIELVSFLSGGDGLTDPDDVPEPPANPVTRLGDVWLCGDHRVMCGDSTKAEDVQTSLGGSVAQMVFTDPPYGVDYTGGMKKRDRLAGDHVGTNIYEAALRHLKFAADEHAALYLWYADGHVSAAAAAAAAAGYQIVAQIIWAKNHAQFMTSAHYKGKHEPCFYAHRAGKKVRWHGPNNEVTLWECNRSPRNDYHPTQKPVELAERAIKNSSAPNDIVLDLFLGGGTTVIAAESAGRRCVGIELSPAYVDVTVNRWQAFTGRDAVLEGTSATFAEIARQRAQKAA